MYVMLGLMARQDELVISQALRPSDLASADVRELASCWAAVTNAGGAVGFAFPPVTVTDVLPATKDLVTSLDPGYSRLLLARVDGALAGWVNLSRGRLPQVAHWGELKRLQTHPDFRGRAIGTALLDRARQVARDELGLEQLRLSARGGEGLEGFYARLGWKEVGRWPGGLRVHLGDRDEVLMLLAPL